MEIVNEIGIQSEIENDHQHRLLLKNNYLHYYWNRKIEINFYFYCCDYLHYHDFDLYAIDDDDYDRYYVHCHCVDGRCIGDYYDDHHHGDY